MLRVKGRLLSLPLTCFYVISGNWTIFMRIKKFKPQLEIKIKTRFGSELSSSQQVNVADTKHVALAQNGKHGHKLRLSFTGSLPVTARRAHHVCIDTGRWQYICTSSRLGDSRRNDGPRATRTWTCWHWCPVPSAWKEPASFLTAVLRQATHTHVWSIL